MIGSPILRIPGFAIFLVAATLQVGATSAVRGGEARRPARWARLTKVRAATV